MSNSASTTVRTRFAPSPSGHLHVGGARTALYCWAYAKARGGSFILRIEDTDQKRSSDAASLGFLEDLRWLGIDWDEGPEYEGCGGGEFGPYFCSKRLDIYHKYIDQLLSEGKAYRAFETPEELQKARTQARASKQNYRYDRAALNLNQASIDKYLAEGKPNVVRFKLPNDNPVTIEDQVRGTVTVDPQELDDFVILKADGFPTYHFAVVVDDELMNISDVIRGQEHLNNTAKHVLIQDALGFKHPNFAHISLIFNPDGSKMSKRDKDKVLRKVVKERNIVDPPCDVVNEDWSWWLESKDHQLDIDKATALAEELDVALPEINVDDFRRAGYLPEVLINYLALLGWSPGNDVEKFDREFLVENFSFDRVIKSPAKFDRDKLLAFSLDAIQALSTEEFVKLWREHCNCYHKEFKDKLSDEQFEMLAAANHPRSKTLDDTVRSSYFFMANDDEIVYEKTKAVRKALCNGEPTGLEHLTALEPLLSQIDDWDVQVIKSVVEEYAEQNAAGKLGKVAQPLRIAVSGGTVSPAIFETLTILGKETVINRIKLCLKAQSDMLSNSNS